ncbi:MAG: TrkH family potassium uptake protein [Candidatus Cloacimonadales bacterium]
MLGKYLKLLQRIISIILSIFALFHLKYLFFAETSLLAHQQNQVTQFSAIILALLLLLKFTVSKDLKYNIRFSLFDLVFIVLLFAVPGSNRVFQSYLIIRQSYVFIRFLINRFDEGKLWLLLVNNPPVILLVSFLAAIIIGALLLMLPNATVQGARTSLMGALFTSTSATCVTGLIVYDTGTHFTLFGQGVILFLIQIGGLGIMTISSAFAVLMGQKMSMKRESMMQSMVGGANRLDMRNLVRNVVFATILIELVGAAILYFTFQQEFYSTQKAIYYSVFHSVSAFCNAGFSLYANSFMDFKFNYNINFAITSLIIMGGIGFPVLSDIRQNFMKRNGLKRLSLQSKIVLSMTVILIFIGIIGFFVAEYHNLMAGFTFSERLSTSFFQSVTTRTAGFNTIDNSSLSKSSVLLSTFLMFVGASPSSTGGGVKTTTFAVIIISVWAMFGNRDVNIFKRRVADNLVKRVMALIAISFLVVFTVLFFLFISEDLDFQKLLFESISAFGTVGLSMGITAELSAIGRGLIIFLMYFGRVGPLTLIFAISETQQKSHFKFTEEKFSIG